MEADPRDPSKVRGFDVKGAGEIAKGSDDAANSFSLNGFAAEPSRRLQMHNLTRPSSGAAGHFSARPPDGAGSAAAELARRPFLFCGCQNAQEAPTGGREPPSAASAGDSRPSVSV